MGDGPPNKYQKCSIEGLDSEAVLSMLNNLADQGYNSVAVAITCTDGPFLFVGGYSDKQ